MSDPKGLSCHSFTCEGQPLPAAADHASSPIGSVGSHGPRAEHLAQNSGPIEESSLVLGLFPLTAFRSPGKRVRVTHGNEERRGRSSLTAACEALGPWSPFPPRLQYIQKFFQGRFWPCLRYFHGLLPWACGEGFRWTDEYSLITYLNIHRRMSPLLTVADCHDSFIYPQWTT